MGTPNGERSGARHAADKMRWGVEIASNHRALVRKSLIHLPRSALGLIIACIVVLFGVQTSADAYEPYFNNSAVKSVRRICMDGITESAVSAALRRSLDAVLRGRAPEPEAVVQRAG